MNARRTVIRLNYKCAGATDSRRAFAFLHQDGRVIGRWTICLPEALRPHQLGVGQETVVGTGDGIAISSTLLSVAHATIVQTWTNYDHSKHYINSLKSSEIKDPCISTMTKYRWLKSSFDVIVTKWQVA